MRLHHIVLIFVLLLSAVQAVGQKRTRNMSNIKQEQQATAKAIKATSKKLDANAAETARSLNQLNTLNAEILQQSLSIKDINRQVDSIDAASKLLGDSIALLDSRLARLRDAYATSVRSVKSSEGGRMSKLSFIFSSESFLQAYRRMRYLKEFSDWRNRRCDEITEVQNQLKDQHRRLEQLQQSKTSHLMKLNMAQAELEKKQKDTALLVSSLRKQGASLKRVLRDKEAQARALDRELERLIAEEQRRQEEEERKARAAREAEEARRREMANAKSKKEKEASARKATAAASKTESATSKPAAKPAETTYNASADAARALSGTFESNKGRLLFPVSGKYKIVRPFGRHQHPSLPHVTTDNGGIDIEVPQGSVARAVFQGEVSSVSVVPGYNTIVLVRHGKYLTIYAGLVDLKVKKGDKVSQGQTIGRIFSDPEDNGRTILHFEIRKEKAKLNPTAWVR